MSAQGALPVPLRRRPSRAVPAIIAGVLLLVAGVLLAWAALSRLLAGFWPSFYTTPVDWLAALSWNSPGMWTAGVILLLLGLMALLSGIVPGGFRALPVHTETAAMPSGPHAGEPTVRGQESVVMSRRAVARLAAATCDHIDGVGSASATATDREVHLDVTTALRSTEDLQRWVVDGVSSRLAASGLDPVPAVTASIRTTQ